MKKKKRQIETMIKVSDNWYPNFSDNMVKVIYIPATEYMAVYGNDDFGMNKINVTRKVYEKLIKRVLNKKILKNMGFKQW